MWIILGNKAETRRVEGGRKVERQCSSCAETAMFYEREVTKSFRLYFVSLFNYETQRVMACGACGALYATDELGRPMTSDTPDDERQKGTVLGTVKDALRRAGNKLQDATGTRVDPDVAAARGEPEQRTAKPTIQPASRRLGAASDDDHGDEDIDPLADADDELNARFAALERRMARGQSAQKPIK